MMPGLFITGTDTGVGKTQIAGAIARLLTNAGVHVVPRKPVESGCVLSGDDLIPGDALTLRTAAKSTQALDQVCPYQFHPAISPERAAAQAGKIITLNELESACLNGSDSGQFLLVEAAGGFYSPLAHKLRCADLAARLGLPVMLVVADRLGCINHTLLSIDAIHSAGLTVSAVILNQPATCPDTEMDNAADLQQWLEYPVIQIQHQSDSSHAWQTIAEQSDQLKNFVERELIQW